MDEILEYVSDRTEVGVRRLLSEFYERFRLLASQPFMGEQVEGCPGLRFSVLGVYVIFYQPAQSDVEIIRFLHGNRDIAAIMQQP